MVDFLDLLPQERHDLGTRGSVAGGGQDLSDLGELEARDLGRADEKELLQGFVAVVAKPGDGTPARRPDEADSVVVAQGVDRKPALSGDFADPHGALLHQPHNKPGLNSRFQQNERSNKGSETGLSRLPVKGPPQGSAARTRDKVRGSPGSPRREREKARGSHTSREWASPPRLRSACRLGRERAASPAGPALPAGGRARRKERLFRAPTFEVNPCATGTTPPAASHRFTIPQVFFRRSSSHLGVEYAFKSRGMKRLGRTAARLEGIDTIFRGSSPGSGGCGAFRGRGPE